MSDTAYNNLIKQLNEITISIDNVIESDVIPMEKPFLITIKTEIQRFQVAKADGEGEPSVRISLKAYRRIKSALEKSLKVAKGAEWQIWDENTIENALDILNEDVKL